MRDKRELMRRYDAAVAAAVGTAEAIQDWSPETRAAVAMTIQIIGREFARTLSLALAAGGDEEDPVSPRRMAEVERDWQLLMR
jgi:hypothetical protein